MAGMSRRIGRAYPRVTFAGGQGGRADRRLVDAGIYKAEDDLIRTAVAAYEVASGNKVELSFIPQVELIMRIVEAMNSGEAPDVAQVVTADWLILPRSAWEDRLVDVSDVLAPRKANFIQAAPDNVYCYNNVRKERAYYAIPMKGGTLTQQIWRLLLEEVGYTERDIPRTHDAHFDFFQDVQLRLRGNGRRVSGLGYSLGAKETDSNTLFDSFLVVYGGAGIVSSDGRLNLDNPVIRRAAITTIERLTTPDERGFVPHAATRIFPWRHGNAWSVRRSGPGGSIIRRMFRWFPSRSGRRRKRP